MPAFLFVSGFLSKNLEKCREKALRSFLLPYVMLTVVVVASRTLLAGKEFRFSLVVPVLTAWYFLVLFWYAIFTPEVVKVRYNFLWIVLLSLGIGVIAGVGDAYAFSKAFAFAPFYLAGYYCRAEHLEKIRSLPRVLSLPALAAAVGIAWWFRTRDVDAVLMFSQKNAYHALGLTNLEGILYRGIGFIGAALMVFVLIQLCSGKKRIYSYIGDNTLVIYSFHMAFLYLIDWLGMNKSTGVFALQFGQVLLFTAITVLLLAVPLWNRLYTGFLDGVYSLFIKKEKGNP